MKSILALVYSSGSFPHRHVPTGWYATSNVPCECESPVVVNGLCLMMDRRDPVPELLCVRTGVGRVTDGVERVKCLLI